MRRLAPFLILMALVSIILYLDPKGFFKRRVTFDKTQGVSTQISVPEISQIKSESNLDKQVQIYLTLIERVGPIEAQEQLQRSGLPFDGQAHLLNHTVGDYLFEKYGAEGLANCRDYFLSSCYHGFVIRAVGDKGIEGLNDVMDNCWQQGGHVAIQCSHSIGHGFLAWVGYKYLLGALAYCDEMQKKSPNFPIYNCHDGVFMENIWAIHDDGKRSPFAWLNSNDPIYPCNEPKIPYQYIKACWSNQPTVSYKFYQGDLSKAGQICEGVKDLDHKQTCFDGLARQIHPLTKGSIDETFKYCSLMPQEWIDPCIISITKAFFSVGDRQIPYQICNRINPQAKDRCFNELTGIIKGYATNTSDLALWCGKIEDPTWQINCLK